jgi:nucleotide-binding universal stress UspA family protein
MTSIRFARGGLVPAARPRRLVVGVDGSQRSLDAVALARRLAAPAGTSVLVANVCPHSFYVPADAIAEQASRAVFEQLRPALEGIARWEPRIVDGLSAAGGLQHVAELEGADLLVVGSSRHGVLSRVALGGVGRRLLHRPPCPIVVAPRGYRAPEGRASVVGAALDGSPEARDALAVAAGWARDLGASLLILHPLAPAGSHFGTPSHRHAAEALRAAARERLAAACASVDVPGGVRGALLDGEPAAALVSASGDLELLVMGVKARGHARVAAAGVAGALVDHAACPVVAVPRANARRRHEHEIFGDAGVA